MIVPADWQAILMVVRAVCPTAVLAGGCLRDLDNVRPVKDLDIFIRAGSAQEVDGIVMLLAEAGLDVTADPTDEGSAYPEDQNLEVIQLGELHGYPIPVQLIFVNWDTSEIVERFDYGICRLSWDGATLTRPPEYDEDKAAAVFRLRRDRPTPISMRGSIRRYARLTAEKYQGWDWWPYVPPGPWLSLSCA